MRDFFLGITYGWVPLSWGERPVVMLVTLPRGVLSYVGRNVSSFASPSLQLSVDFPSTNMKAPSGQCRREDISKVAVYRSIYEHHHSFPTILLPLGHEETCVCCKAPPICPFISKFSPSSLPIYGFFLDG